MNRFSNLNPLKKWIITNKYYVKTTDSKENKMNATHYLLDGGIWKIPKEEYQNFLRLLAVDLQNNEKHYICENRTEVFKFICDLDFYDDSVITLEQVSIIIKVIQEIVEEYYGSTKVIICCSDSKTVVLNDTSYTKSGFHLVWPKIWINARTAKELRLLFISKLINTFSERHDINTWSEVVDLSVYEDNGLRMIGCRKMGVCKSCKNKKEFRDSCLTCNGIGRIDENRVYKPKKVLHADPDYIHSIDNDYYIMLIETSIYNFNNFEATPLLKELSITEKSSATVSKKTIKERDELTIKVENFIKKHYRKITVKKITKTENCLYIIPDDNFCLNVNRCHTSSGIYFQITPTGACQRCYCKKDTLTGRSSGPCTTFSSENIPISAQFRNFIFGATVKTRKKKNVNLVNCVLTRSNTSSSLDLSIVQTNSDVILSNKEMCKINCESLLLKLENDLVKK